MTYMTLRASPEADVLARELPAVWEKVQQALEPIRRDDAAMCGHGLDGETRAWVCFDDAVVRCRLCAESHTLSHGHVREDCDACGEEGTARVHLADETLHRWVADPDRPEVELRVPCLVICHFCDEERRR